MDRADVFRSIPHSIAKLCAAGRVNTADHEIVHADDEQEVVVPAGAGEPSIKTAALVVAGDT